ncbi:anti-repressor SinI family protein [Bacillus sp. IB182487]|uniref:Anti-repressor SinI family protein n=1 Tax=Metabacillus arenae TaxID=2771434 RepID=A0A926RVH0_9BACI|nr:anti-repressor SinI family protein [Metabacillus arenae]
MNVEILDDEWLQLIIEAQRIGLTIEEIQSFLEHKSPLHK